MILLSQEPHGFQFLVKVFSVSDGNLDIDFVSHVTVLFEGFLQLPSEFCVAIWMFFADMQQFLVQISDFPFQFSHS